MPGWCQQDLHSTGCQQYTRHPLAPPAHALLAPLAYALQRPASRTQLHGQQPGTQQLAWHASRRPGTRQSGCLCYCQATILAAQIADTDIEEEDMVVGHPSNVDVQLGIFLYTIAKQALVLSLVQYQSSILFKQFDI